MDTNIKAVQPSTRQTALERLAAFVPHTGADYARLRNFDLGEGEHRHVSNLSGALRHRLILEQEVVSAVLEHHSLNIAEKYVQEVCWRTYWKGWLEMRPQVWSDYRQQVQQDLARLADERPLRERYEAAIQGRTGIDCWDAWAEELVTTGYLHNHARMWTASIWIYTLQLPWALGADWFYRHLIDGDPASNTLSWRWVGGLQTRGKTYLARPDNIAKFTRGRFTPSPSQLARDAPALPGDEPPPAQPVADPDIELDTHALPPGRTLLLLTEEDLYPESWPIGNASGATVAALRVTERRSPEPVAEAALEYASRAVADGLKRAAATVDSNADAPTFSGSNAVAELSTWCADRQIDQVLTAWAPIGPVARALTELRRALGEHDVGLLRWRRPWDSDAWPLARRGFFPFKKHIPELVQRHC